MGGFMFYGKNGSAEQAGSALKVHASGFQGTRLYWLLRVLAVVAALMVVGRGAWAMTAVGALLTNFATATLITINGHPYEAENNATARVIVLEPPIIALTKLATPSVGSPGDVITYTICAMNLSWSFSAFNITIRDVLPDNMAWVPIADPASNWSWFTPNDGATWTRSSSAAEAGPYAGMGAGGTPPAAGQGGPYYLRWVATMFGPRKSGCVQFQVSIQ